MNENSLTGSIPTEIGRLTRITQLFFFLSYLFSLFLTRIFRPLHDNSLTGPIPTEIGKLIQLKSMFLFPLFSFVQDKLLILIIL